MKRQIVGALVVTAGTPIRPSAFSSPNVWTAWKTEVIERHAYTSGFSDINGNCLLLRLLSGLVFWKRTGCSISSQSIESSLTSPSRKKNLSGLLSSRTNATAQFCYSRNKNAPITLSLSLLPLSFSEKERNMMHLNTQSIWHLHLSSSSWWPTSPAVGLILQRIQMPIGNQYLSEERV